MLRGYGMANGPAFDLILQTLLRDVTRKRSFVSVQVPERFEKNVGESWD